nr:cobalamin biosynthesis protein [Desulfitobacterium hafniense]
MSSISAVVMTLAFVLDQIVGDPKSLPHPVVGIGRVISILESLLNYGSAEAKRIKGVLLAFLIVGGSWFLTWIVVKYAYFLNNYFGIVVEVYLIFTTLAGKSLLDAGRNVLIPLKEGDLEQARVRLSWLVSRNTSSLPEGEVVRGTVETIAENFVDGILSPLIYAFIGGAPL